MIYADNAATTMLDEDALRAMIPYLTEQYANASQPYSFSKDNKKALKEAREVIAHCIGAKADEIYFTSGGTESDNWAIKGLIKHGDNRATITSSFEHHAILRACESIENLGFPVTYILPNKKAIVTPRALRASISINTKLVSIMMANNEVGTIQPIKELCEVAHEYGALFHTDAVQAVGHVPIDVNLLGVDMLSASAHKFNGPKGIGFLYIKKNTQLKPYMDGGAQEYGMRAGTENVALIVAMAVALKKNFDNIVQNKNHINQLEEQLIKSLSLSGVDYICNGDSPKVPGNISLSFRGIEGEMLLHRLDLMGICVSTGSACNGSSTEISHVLQAIEIPDEYVNGTIRISLGKNLTVTDIEKIVQSICKIISL